MSGANVWGRPGPLTIGPARATLAVVFGYEDAASGAKHARKPWVREIRRQLTSEQCTAAARGAWASYGAPYLTHAAEMEYR